MSGRTDEPGAPKPLWGPFALIRRLWRGEVPMWRAFWFYWVLPLVGFTLYATILQAPGVTEWLVERFADPSGVGRAVMALMRLVATAFLAYMIFMAVAVWRSAANFAGPRHWSWLVRACMVFYLVSVVARCIGTPAA